MQAQLTAAQANYDNLKQELDDIQQKGLDAAAAMLGVQAAQNGLDDAKKNLADFEAWMKSGIFKSGSGGGGGSKSIYSKEYEQITDMTKHYIKMSDIDHLSVFSKLNSDFQSRHLLQNALLRSRNRTGGNSA